MAADRKPRISVVMVDGSFRERFHAVDAFGRQSLPPDEVELIWVEFYDRIHPDLQARIARYPNARIITLRRDGIYHSSACFNAGIQASRADILFIPDADIVVEPTFLERAVLDHELNPKLAMYFYRMEEPEGERAEDASLEHLKRVGRLSNPQNFGACLSLRKGWLLTLNGYEEHPTFSTGFHANGLEVFTRIKNLGLHVRWHPELFLYHPWHPFCMAPSPLYKVQKAVIRFKARHLMTGTFMGIDPAHDVEFPESLASQMDRLKKELALDKVYHDWADLKVDPKEMGGSSSSWQVYTPRKGNKGSEREG